MGGQRSGNMIEGAAVLPVLSFDPTPVRGGDLGVTQQQDNLFVRRLVEMRVVQAHRHERLWCRQANDLIAFVTQLLDRIMRPNRYRQDDLGGMRLPNATKGGADSRPGCDPVVYDHQGPSG